jgi:hypothetical protein
MGTMTIGEETKGPRFCPQVAEIMRLRARGARTVKHSDTCKVVRVGWRGAWRKFSAKHLGVAIFLEGKIRKGAV